MSWIIGIDEAGYGPNLGPFVMTAVACRFAPYAASRCLWESLPDRVRRGGKAAKGDDRVVLDDSKVVHAAGKGVAALERGVWAMLPIGAATLGDLLAELCGDADRAELAAECWYAGTLAVAAEREAHAERRSLIDADAASRGLTHRLARTVTVCPRRFNAITDRHATKAGVTAESFVQLLGWANDVLPAEEPIHVFTDKQGGRNSYTAQIAEALPGGWVTPLEETAGRSRYRVSGLARAVELTFAPRMDGEQAAVALASMVSKYVRELCMAEFNAFWATLVPGLSPTAGYPVDAARFFAAIREAMAARGIDADDVWRRR